MILRLIILFETKWLCARVAREHYLQHGGRPLQTGVCSALSDLAQEELHPDTSQNSVQMIKSLGRRLRECPTARALRWRAGDLV